MRPLFAAEDRLWLIISALAGAAIGGLLFPKWRHAIDSARVLAGIVDYPPDSPFYLYHVQAFCLPHQVIAG